MQFQTQIGFELLVTMLTRSSTGSALQMIVQSIKSGEIFAAVRALITQFILSQAFKMSIALMASHPIMSIASSKFFPAFRALQVRFQVIGHRGQVLEQKTDQHS